MNLYICIAQWGRIVIITWPTNIHHNSGFSYAIDIYLHYLLSRFFILHLPPIIRTITMSAAI